MNELTDKQRALYGREMSDTNAYLQKQVAERAAKYEPVNPLDDLRSMRDVARLALPELMEFVDQAIEHIEQLSDENERLWKELECKSMKLKDYVGILQYGTMLHVADGYQDKEYYNKKWVWGYSKSQFPQDVQNAEVFIIFVKDNTLNIRVITDEKAPDVRR